MESRRFLAFLAPTSVLVLTYALLISSTGSLLSQTNKTQTGATSTPVIMFGVGSPNINAERSGTSIGIVVAGTLYVFDAGAGVERRIMEAGPKLAALNVQRFGPIFITHLHRDHTIGLAALLQYHNMNSSGRLSSSSGVLTVYGPSGISAVMDHLRAAFADPGLAPGIRPEELSGVDVAPVRTTEITPGVVYRNSDMTVTAFEVAHKSPISFGFRVQTADRVIVISGDTRPVDTVVDACRGCDFLFHELNGLQYGPGGPTGNAQGHTSAAELGELARRAKPQHLVIYHDVNAPHDAALEMIRKTFPGDVKFAQDLDIF